MGLGVSVSKANLDRGQDGDDYASHLDLTALSHNSGLSRVPSDRPIHLNVPKEAFRDVKVLFFDLMGTCLDWHSSIVHALPATNVLPPSSGLGQEPETGQAAAARSQFALRWRQGFFDEIHARFGRGVGGENIDVPHRRILDRLLDAANGSAAAGDGGTARSEAQKQDAVQAWHSMRAWPDVDPALKRPRTKYEVVVLANGMTRLRLDLMRSSGLQFDVLFSSQLLGLTKLGRRVYERAVELVGGGGGGDPSPDRGGLERLGYDLGASTG